MADRYRILSIDGGGIRGIIPGMALTALEEAAGRPIHELFDLVAGTSTGGILALGLTCPAADGPGARYTAGDLVALYEDHGAAIFHRHRLRRMPGVGLLADMARAKYPPGPIDRILEDYFGGVRLKEALADVLVPAYEIERRAPFFFKSRRAREDDDYDFAIADVARATSAAPTFFTPHRIDVDDDYYALVDGGVFANNPAMCAIAEAIAVARTAGSGGPDEGGSAGEPELVVASFGTGSHTRRIPYDQAVDYGLVQWAPRLLSVMMDGNNDTVGYQAERAVPDGRHFRFDVKLDAASDDMDNASEENVRNLRLLGEELVAGSRDRFEKLAALLDPSD